MQLPLARSHRANIAHAEIVKYPVKRVPLTDINCCFVLHKSLCGHTTGFQGLFILIIYAGLGTMHTCHMLTHCAQIVYIIIILVDAMNN